MVNGASTGTVGIVMAGAATGGVFVPIFSRAWQKVRVDKDRLNLKLPTGGITLALPLIAVQIAILAPGIRLG